MSDFFLFLDFETTGLDIDSLTVLEVSWTITDGDLTQCTPLRSRMCGIATDLLAATLPGEPGLGVVRWNRDLSRVVADMHAASGLSKDWVRTPHFAVLRSRADLDRVLYDDLARSGWTSRDALFLAGSGVGHYDHPLLRKLGSGLVRSGGELHYRPADVSSAITLLGVPSPKTPRELCSLSERVAAACNVPHDRFNALLVDESTETLVTRKPGASALLDFDAVINHRAASDVAFALVLSRVLRAMVTLP